MDVAEAFIEDTGSDEPESIIEAARLVGEHLAARDLPGHWAAFDAGSFYAAHRSIDRRQLIGISIQVMALFQWLGLKDAIDIDRAAMISAAIRTHAPRSAILDDFHASYERSTSELRK